MCVGEGASAGLRDGSDGFGLVDPDVLVELVGQGGVEIVALQFGVGPINDPDRALETRKLELEPYFGADRFP